MAMLGKSRRRTPLPALALAGLILAACSAQANPQLGHDTLGGNPDQGKVLIHDFGCGACHAIPGIAGANGAVGPPLAGIAERGYIAGKLRTTPENMVTWIMHPQQIVPGNAMPDMGVSEQDAKDITAYLYSLRP